MKGNSAKSNLHAAFHKYCSCVISLISLLSYFCQLSTQAYLILQLLYSDLFPFLLHKGTITVFSNQYTYKYIEYHSHSKRTAFLFQYFSSYIIYNFPNILKNIFILRHPFFLNTEFLTFILINLNSFIQSFLWHLFIIT